MSIQRIGLDALRRRVADPHSAATPGARFEAPRRPLTRRELLGYTAGGATALSLLSPTLRAIGGSLAGQFDIVGDQKRLAFMLGGKERFVIDVKRFGGRPTIALERHEQLIRVALRDATWPGTDLSADLSIEIRSGLYGRTMLLEMELGRFRSRMQLEQWLTSRGGARSIVELDDVAAPLGHRGRAGLIGTAEAWFSTDWRLRLDGAGIARVDGLGGELRADQATLSLHHHDEGVVLDTTGPRTLITMERGSDPWPVEPIAPAEGGWSFGATSDPFDRILLELPESRPRRALLLAESLDETSRLWAEPVHGPLSSLGEPARLPLAGARYAVAFEGASVDTALVARFGPERTWVHAEGGSFLVGGGGTALFEHLTRNGRTTRVDARPHLRSMLLEIQGADGSLSEPVDLEAGERIEIVAGLNARNEGMAWPGGPVEGEAIAAAASGTAEPIPAAELMPADTVGSIRFNPLRPDEPKRALVTRPKISIVRPEDLLVLDFEFVNMTFEGKGKGSLVRSGSGESLIIVKFPPQNIAERALFERDPNMEVKANPSSSGDAPPDTAAGINTESPASNPPPLSARMSGPTRLVFRVPSSVTSLDLSIEKLLEACSDYQLKVTEGAAEPAPAEVKFKLDRIRLLKRFDVREPSGGGGSLRVQSKPTASGATASAGTISNAMAVVKAARVQRQVSRAVAKAQIEAMGVAPKYTRRPNLGIDSKVGVMKVIPKIRRPTSEETAIEAPFRLIVSPNRHAKWVHMNEPVVGANNRVELWHTRLSVREDEGVDVRNPRFMTMRAIWARDQETFEKPGFDPQNPALYPPHQNEPFRSTLDSYDRFNVVHLTANYTLKNPPPASNTAYVPVPVSVNRLMLSSLGAWVDSRGAWDKLPRYLSVEEWRHRGTMGRDHYVRVVYAGFLYPLGHRASLVKVTERKFHEGPNGPIAYLFQRMFIVVREPERTYDEQLAVNTPPPNEQAAPASKRRVDLSFPFNSARITTLVTPNLDQPEQTAVTGGGLVGGQSCFWPAVGGDYFPFHVILEDIDGEEHELTMPLAFIGKEVTDDDAKVKVLRDLTKSYETAGAKNSPDWERRRRGMSGQRVTFGEYRTPGDTSFETVAITFGAEVPEDALYNSLPYSRPRYFPVVRGAEVVIPSIKQIAGADAPGSVRFAKTYLEHGFDAGVNKGEVLFDMLPDGNVTLDFSKKGDRSGGLVKPNMNITGLSRAMGPVGGKTTELAGGNFDPKDFFDGLMDSISPKVFGVISLWDIVRGVAGDLLGNIDLVPKFVTEALDKVETFLSFIDTIEKRAAKLKSLADPNTVTVPSNAVKGKLDELLDVVTDLVGPSGAIPNLFSADGGSVDERIAAVENSINAIGGKLDELAAMVEDAAANVEIADRRFFQEGYLKVREVITNMASFLEGVRSFAGLIPTELPRELTLKFEWRPKIGDWGFVPNKPIFIASDAGKKGALVIGVEAKAKTDGGGSPSASIFCSLENFTADLIAPASFIALHFEKVQFIASTGLKADVNVVLRELEFIGPLSFIETLKDLIPLDGFSDPPAIDVSAEGIKAGFSIPIPGVAVGVFSLKNLSFSAGFTIPFIGDPLSVNFSFCSRENPFQLTVMMFGGGGFFGITLDPGGIQLFEAAFEFGASLSVDFGVASGGVEIMAGLYFKMSTSGGSNDCLLQGYLRLHGYVDVLGLIGASITLNLELNYEPPSGKCVGRATLIIEVHVFVFSGSVEVTAEKKFSGANGDPTFAEQMGPALLAAPTKEDPDHMVEVFPWSDYCSAFA